MSNLILLKTSNYEFEVKYRKMKSGCEYFMVSNGQCSIIIKKYIEIPDDIFLEHLDLFDYDFNDSSGETRSVEMLLAILQYVRDFYGTNLNYIFQDNSLINILGKQLKMNLIYILLYGKTWYMKYVDAVSLSNEFNQNLAFINEYLDTTKDNITKFFRRSFEYIGENNNNNNDDDDENNNHNNDENNKTTISDIVVLDHFLHLMIQKNAAITKRYIWKNIKYIYSLASSSLHFFKLLYKKYGMAIFVILDYYEYYKYISYKFEKILHLECHMQIPNDFINSINIIY